MAPWTNGTTIGVILTFVLLLQTVNSLNASYRITEELEPGTVVGNVRTDAGLAQEYGQTVLDQLRFRILPPDNDDAGSREYFTVDETTGIVRLSSKIDRDDQHICAFQNTCYMTFEVVVSPALYFRVINVQVEILDINDNAPSFSAVEYRLNISESSLPGTTYNLPSVFDPDSSVFGIKEFEIRPSTGQFKVTWTQDLQGRVQPKLQLLEQLDREKLSMMELSIVAYDNGSPANSAALLVHLTVQDTNDNSPEFDLPAYETRINENARVGTPILTIHAADPDVGVGGTVRYSLTAQTLGEPVTKFRIDPVSGVIFLAESVDREDQQVYDMQVIAKDMGSDERQASATVTVYIDDVNDNAPVIRISVISSSGRAEVSEAADVGTFVALLSVTDKDWGQNAEVSCRLSSSRFSMQVMQPQNKFKIVTEGRLDREDQSRYEVSVSCEDKGVPTQSAHEIFSVHVTDINDHQPVFSRPQYEGEVIENSPLGVDVIQVEASDSDVGNNSDLSYRLLDDASGRFVIDADSGMIRTRSQFDFEKEQQIRLEVEARDHGTPVKSAACVVIVKIVDVNDQPPVFGQAVYTFVVKENQVTEPRIGQVSATDKDSSQYGKFFYSLRADEPESLDYFDIHPDNGTLVLLKPLDRESQPFFYMSIVATNTEPPALSSTASLTIYVDDVNDNSPIVDFPSRHNNTATISNRLPPGYKVTQIRAHDLDSGDNSELNYFLVHDRNDSQRFGIDPKSGEVFLNHDVSKVKVETYHVVVLVKDNGIPERSTHANLSIVVNQSVAVLLNGADLPSSGDDSASNNMLIIIIVVAISGVVIIVLLASIVFVLLTSRRKGANDSMAAASIVMDPIDTDSNYGNRNGGSRAEPDGKALIKPTNVNINDIAVHMEKEHQRYVALSNQPSLNLSNNASSGDQKSPIHTNTPPVPPRGVFVSYNNKAPNVDTSFMSDESDQTKQELLTLTGMAPGGGRRPVEVDRASASSADDSVTDSGRGASEEGEPGDDHGPPRLPPKQPRLNSVRREPPPPGHTSPYYNTDPSHRHSQSSYTGISSRNHTQPGHLTQGQPNLGQPNLGQQSLGQPNLGQHNLGQPNLGQPNLGNVTQLSGHTQPGHQGHISPSELVLRPDYGLSHLQTEFDPHYRLKYNDIRHGCGNPPNIDVIGRYAPSSDVIGRYAPTDDVSHTSPEYSEQNNSFNSQGNYPLNKQTVRNVKAKDKNKKIDYVSSAINNSSLINRYQPRHGDRKSSSANSLAGNSFSDSNSLLKYKSQSGSTCSDLTDATSVTSATSGSYVIDHDDDVRDGGFRVNSMAVSTC